LRLAWVELRDFRNHVETRLDELPDALITVAGPNGEGKTNLLEGIAFLFFLQSPRTSSTEPWSDAMRTGPPTHAARW
jgi:recombinational DNA repair ATPase RecF